MSGSRNRNGNVVNGKRDQKGGQRVSPKANRVRLTFFHHDREMKESADTAQALLESAFYGTLNTSKQKHPDAAASELQKVKAFAMNPENLPQLREKLAVTKMRRILNYWAAASREFKTEQRLRANLYSMLRPPSRAAPIGFVRAPPNPAAEAQDRAGAGRVSRACAKEDAGSAQLPLASTRPRGQDGVRARGRGGKKKNTAREEVNELLALFQNRELPVFRGKLTNGLL